jgi:lipopolysaccharide export LptBFGC system permease protein LptF
MTLAPLPLAALLLVFHGDDAHLAKVYFWSAVLIALTPVLIFSTIAVWLWRMYRKEKAMRNAEVGMRN